jgi:uncharacterized protein
MLLDILLLLTSLFAGAINAVAGGGTFFVFPALLFAGISPISANATCTVALWPGALASVIAFRHKLRGLGRSLVWMVLLGAIFGYVGAQLLLVTQNATFAAMIPWLLLIATGVFAYGKKIAAWMDRLASASVISPRARLILCIVFQIATALYGGFFGAGIGILTLAMLQLLGQHDMHHINAVKTVIASAINASAFFTFILSDIVAWDKAVLMAAGGMIGGYAGAWLSLKVPDYILRKFVIIVASLMTVYFFYTTYIIL